MTNEELTILSEMAKELCGLRTNVDDLTAKRSGYLETIESLGRERDRLIRENNALRGSEANALNDASDAVRERDEAQKKLGEWARFINLTIYTALVTAANRKDCRKIVSDVLEAMRNFQKEHSLTMTEEGRAK